jgi:hypothetical protein
MKRHPFDLTSFLFGIVFGSAAAAYLLADQLAWDVDGRWVLPIALIVLGVAGIAGAVGGLRPSRPDAVSDPEPADASAGSEHDLVADASQTP